MQTVKPQEAEPGRLEDSPVPEEGCLFNRNVPECPSLSEPWSSTLQGFCVDELEASLLSPLGCMRASKPRDVEGLQGKVYYISSWSTSEHHRQGTSSLNEFLFTAILLRSIQMMVNMYFYFLKILSDSSYWEIIWLLLRPPFSSWDMQKVSGDTEVWLWKLNLTSWRLSLINMGQIVPKSDSNRVLHHLTMSSESWR